MTSKLSRKEMITAVSCTLILLCHSGYGQLYNLALPNIMSDLGVTATSLTLGPMISMLLCTALSLVAAKLISSWSPKVCMYIATAVLLWIAFLYLIATSVWHIWISSWSRAILIALGTHATITTIMNVNIANGKKFSAALGIVFGICGFSGAITTAIMTPFMGHFGWRVAHMITAVILAVICLVCNTLFVPGRKKMAELTSAAEEASVKEEGTTVDSGNDLAVGLTLAEARKTASFYLLLLCTLFASSLWMFTTYTGLLFASNGIEATTYGVWLTILNISAGVFTLASGIIISKLGAKMTMLISFGLSFLAMILWYVWTGSPSNALAIAACILIGACRPGSQAIPNLLIPQLFGRKEIAKLSPVVMAANYICWIVISPLISSIFDKTESMKSVIILMGAFAILAGACSILAIKLNPMKKMKVAA